MMSRVRLLVATTNRHKLREIRAILADEPVEVIGLDEFPGIAEPEEVGATFAENARDKARYYSAKAGVPAVAEDSGLEVDAIGGEPGVHSARYGGPTAERYADKFRIIYAKLADRGLSRSTARFVCALAAASGDRVLFETRGTIEGEIAAEPHGDGGFGYDPIFFFPPCGRTLAELTEAEKSTVSHRGQAFRDLARFLAERGPGAFDGVKR
jgi:XTP/dITP diphosphohydrolase